MKDIEEKIGDATATPSTRLLLEWEAATMPGLFPIMKGEPSVGLTNGRILGKPEVIEKRASRRRLGRRLLARNDIQSVDAVAMGIYP